MRYMGWTWDAYVNTPASVIDRLLETLQKEHDERAGDHGPRQTRQLNR